MGWSGTEIIGIYANDYPKWRRCSRKNQLILAKKLGIKMSIPFSVALAWRRYLDLLDRSLMTRNVRKYREASQKHETCIYFI
jgi:hypothetical protein